MDQSQNSNRRTSTQRLVTSVWVPSPPPPPPPPPPPSQRRESTFSYDHLNNSPTNPIYKTELIINPTPTKINVNNCFKCGGLIENNNSNEIKFNNKYYHMNCFICSVCRTNMNSYQTKTFQINDNGEPICPTCQLSKGKRCYLCQQLILDGKLINFDENSYHKDCFNCYQCRKSLNDQINIHLYDLKLCCDQCYEQKSSLKCSECLKRISNEKYTIYQGKQYHLDCFKCFYCPNIIKEMEFSIYNSNPCCDQCFQTKFSSKCQQCFQPIREGKSIIYNENKYHPNCFRCCKCSQVINDSKFAKDNDKPCCIRCYEKYVLPECSKCHRPINDKATVYQGKHFHLNCFICQTCYRIIGQNQTFSHNQFGIQCTNCRI